MGLVGDLDLMELPDGLGVDGHVDGFELAEFHDAVLRHGSVPLEVLPMAVEAYVEAAGGG